MSLPSITCNNAGNIEIVQNKKTGLVAKNVIIRIFQKIWRSYLMIKN